MGNPESKNASFPKLLAAACRESDEEIKTCWKQEIHKFMPEYEKKLKDTMEGEQKINDKYNGAINAYDKEEVKEKPISVKIESQQENVVKSIVDNDLALINSNSMIKGCRPYPAFIYFHKMEK